MPSSRAASPANSINDQDSPKPLNVQNTQNSSSRSSSAHNRNRRQISATNRRTRVPSLSLRNRLTESNASNSHNQSTTDLTNINFMPTRYNQNQQYTPLPEIQKNLLNPTFSPKDQKFRLSIDRNNSATWQNSDINSDRNPGRGTRQKQIGKDRAIIKSADHHSLNRNNESWLKESEKINGKSQRDFELLSFENLKQISASNSKTIDLGFSSINFPNEINVWNCHKQSTNDFTDVNGKPITYDQNQHTHSPSQYSPTPETNQYLAQINQLQSALKESKGINLRLQQDFDDCKVKLNHSQRRNSQLESANKYEHQINRDQCANCAESTRQLQNQKSRVKKKIEELAKDFQLKMEDSNSTIEKLKSELNQSVNKCKSLQNENDSNKSQFSGQIGKLELIIKEINEERQILQNKYDECKLRFNQSNHEEQILQWQTEMKNLTTKYDKLQSDRDNLKLLVKEIDDKNKILQNNYNKSGEENENLKFQCDKYLAEINKLESVLKESDRTNRRLQQEFDAKSKHSDRNSQLESANLFKSQMDRNRFENNAELIKQLQNQKETDKRKVEEITKDFQLKIENLNRSIEKMLLELSQSENKCKSLQNDNNNIKSQFAAQIEQLQSALKESDRKMGSLQRDFEDCKEKLKHSQERNIQLENEMAVKKQTIEEITEDFQLKMEDSNSSIEKLKLELNRSKDEYKRLQDENNNIKSGFASQIEKLELKMNEINEENKILQNNYSQSKLNQSEIDKINLQKENEKLKSSNNHAECKLKFNQSETEKSILIAEKSPESQLFIDSTKGANTNEIGALEYKKNIPVIPVPPIGFNNPKGYCYLNCVIQVLASCDDFKKDIEKSDCSECFDGTDDSIFVKGLFDLIHALRNSDFNSVKESLNIIQQYITESSFGDDVYKCFMNILSRVSKVIKTNIQRPNAYSSLPVTVMEKAQKNFEKFKNKNPGLVFDNFYGQLTFQMTCDICAEICNESFQVIKSLTLAVPKSTSPIMLEDCINLFFNFSLVNVDEPLKCGCPKGSKSVKSITKLTHGPKYLFIYLNRGSYTDNGAKIDTFVTCSKKSIEIKDSTNNAIKYRLISVIDHVGNTFYGHYYCRSNFEESDWWLLNDAHVEKCSDDEVVTKNAIVFLFKKEID